MSYKNDFNRFLDSSWDDHWDMTGKNARKHRERDRRRARRSKHEQWEFMAHD